MKNKSKINIRIVDNEFFDLGWILLDPQYNGSTYYMNCLCPNGHLQQKTYKDLIKRKRNCCKFCNKENKLKNKNVIKVESESESRCKIKKLKEIKEICKKYNIICTSEIYEGYRKKLKFICTNGHLYYNRPDRFKSCIECFKKNMSLTRSGENHHNFNSNREKVNSNRKLRRKKSKEWIIKNMKDDPNYNDYLINPRNYVVDHIFPIYAFSKILSEKIYTEKIIKKIANKRDNLQLLTVEENFSKFKNYNENEFNMWFKNKIINEINKLK